MKKLTLDEWEKKYIVGPIERYDQRKMIPGKPRFALEAEEQSKVPRIIGDVKDKPGFTLMDQALRLGGWAGNLLDALDTSKPNPPHVAKEVGKVLTAFGGDDPATFYHPPEGVKLDVSNPQEITRNIKKAAIFFGADLVGVCKLDQRWLYSHTVDMPQWLMLKGEGRHKPPFEMPEGMPMPPIMEAEPQEVPEEYQYAIVMGFEMEYNLTKYFPTFLALAAVTMGYSRMAFTSLQLSSFIRTLGFKAINCATNEVALTQPMAMQAGLGELGRMGVVITPKFGPRVRLAPVLTDLPLVPDSPLEFGVTEFCRVCKKCADMCPSRCILHGERSTESARPRNNPGILRWQVDTEACELYWTNNNRDCGICISVCPYNKVNTWPHRIVRWFADHVRWADSFYVKMDDLLGYGKPRKADNFWKEWQPRRQ